MPPPAYALAAVRFDDRIDTQKYEIPKENVLDSQSPLLYWHVPNAELSSWTTKEVTDCEQRAWMIRKR